MIDDDFDDSDDALGNRLKVLRSSHLLRHLCWQLGGGYIHIHIMVDVPDQSKFHEKYLQVLIKTDEELL